MNMSREKDTELIYHLDRDDFYSENIGMKNSVMGWRAE
jgi:hypothetical protein